MFRFRKHTLLCFQFNVNSGKFVAKTASISSEKVAPSNPIGRRLRQLRKEHDWTLADVARRTGISVGTLSKLEHGKTDLNIRRGAMGQIFPPKETRFYRFRFARAL